MNRLNLSILFFLALMLGSLGLLLFANPSGTAANPQAEAEPAIQVDVLPVLAERIVLEDELSGRVAAFRRVEIRPQVGGLILERKVDEGTRVKAGDLLFRIDPAPLEADLRTAEAALARAEAAASHARRAMERSDVLFARNAVSQEKNDSAHNDLVLADTGLAEARAVVERRRLDLGFATLRAPIDGYVAGGLSDVGGLAAPGGEKPLAVVQDLEKVFIDIRLPSDRLDPVLLAAEAGLGPVRILPDRAGAAALTGVLRFSDVIVDPGTGHVSIRIEANNPDLALLPGMFVRALLPRGVVADALLVPEDAVLRRGDGTAQLVVVSDKGEAERRAVTLGDRIGNQVVITAGLKPGERVAVRGQDRVPDGVMLPVTTRSANELTEISLR